MAYRGVHKDCRVLFFFFKDTAAPEIYPLSLHDALPICLISQKTRRPQSNPVRRQLVRPGGKTGAELKAEGK